MKKKALASVVALALLAPLRAFPAETAAGSFYREDASHTLRMRVPAEWRVAEDAPFGVTAFLLPASEPAGRFDENVNILAERLPAAAASDLEAYSRHAERQIAAFVPQARILETGFVRFGRHRARRVVYTGFLGDIAMKWLQVWLLDRGSVIVITYSADRAEFERSLDSVERALASLQVV